jgi:hypothetical protein
MTSIIEAEQRIRTLAEEHVRRWTGDLLDDPDSYEREHTEAIVERVKDALAGTDERPWLHSHADSELGVCTECDAATVLFHFEEAEDDRPG